MHAVSIALALAAAAPGPGGGVRWIEDDYARALAEARARNVAIVVDVWAPW